MIIHIDPALPCAQYQDEPRNGSGDRLCRRLASIGIIVPTEGDVWELMPVCQMHFDEVSQHLGDSSVDLTPTIFRHRNR